MNRRSVTSVQARPQNQRHATGVYTVCVVIGTRSDAIKLAPVIRELRGHRNSVRSLVVVTSGQEESLVSALGEFGLAYDADLSLGARPVSLAAFTSEALTAFSNTFIAIRPDAVLVHGDSSAILAACLAAHYLGIPVGHVGAGVRAESGRGPFPAELNRRLASVAADVHFAASERAQQNLLHEGVSPERVLLTGNTVVDALRCFPTISKFTEQRLNLIPWEKRRVLLVALHERQSGGEAARQVCLALSELIAGRPDIHVLMPMPRDPALYDAIMEELGGTQRIEFLETLSYCDMLEAMRRASLVLTDSGTVQEEACVLGRPVVVLLRSTDRPEVVSSGCAVLAGTSARVVADCTTRLLDDDRALESLMNAPHPYGDGLASQRIVQALLSRFPRQAGGTSIPEGPAILPPAHAIER